MFPQKVEQGHTARAIVYRRLDVVDIVNLSGTIAVRSEWLIFVAAERLPSGGYASFLSLEADADAMHNAIQRPGITPQSGRLIHDCRRQSEYDDEPMDGATQTGRMLGGEYWIWTTPA